MSPNLPAQTVLTSVPGRLDRLPWGSFHWQVIAALGVTWILDGLEVNLVGSVSSAIQHTLSLTGGQLGLTATAYLIGVVAGALFFGWIADRYGRKLMFFVVLSIYILGTLLSAAAWDFWSLCLFRMITGIGIGGEYSAINSTIQELIPARARGRVTIAINGSYWIGTALGALGSMVILHPAVFGPDTGWRAGFFIGAILSVFILFMRLWIPESPRWLVSRGRSDKAEAIVQDIERKMISRGALLASYAGVEVAVRVRKSTPLREVFQILLVTHRQRSALCLCLMSAQAFMYNAIFFTYALMLGQFYGIAPHRIGLYLLPFAAACFMGPLLLGHLFDKYGRRTMISLTYLVAGVLLVLTGWLFLQQLLNVTTQTLMWVVIFFFGATAGPSAYLTISEIFPTEIRAFAIAIFVAVGTGVGGAAAPWIFGLLIGSGQRVNVFWGYLLAGGLMAAAGVIAALWGVAAERKMLEDIA